MFDNGRAVVTGDPAGRTHRYAELHAHSAYSFLDGANEPEDLIAAAAELGLEALALTDHDGLPGIVKHAEAGRARVPATGPPQGRRRYPTLAGLPAPVIYIAYSLRRCRGSGRWPEAGGGPLRIETDDEQSF